MFKDHVCHWTLGSRNNDYFFWCVHTLLDRAPSMQLCGGFVSVRGWVSVGVYTQYLCRRLQEPPAFEMLRQRRWKLQQLSSPAKVSPLSRPSLTCAAKLHRQGPAQSKPWMPTHQPGRSRGWGWGKGKGKKSSLLSRTCHHFPLPPNAIVLTPRWGVRNQKLRAELLSHGQESVTVPPQTHSPPVLRITKIMRKTLSLPGICTSANVIVVYLWRDQQAPSCMHIYYPHMYTRITHIHAVCFIYTGIK